MKTPLIPEGKILGTGLVSPPEGQSVQSFTSRPLISETVYNENLFTLHGKILPTGDADWSAPDWWPWQPKDEDQKAEEEPKGSEQEQVPQVYVRQESSIKEYLFLAGFLLLGVWAAKRF